MYLLAQRSPRTIYCTTQNHALRYAAIRKQRQLISRGPSTRSLWGAGKQEGKDAEEKGREAVSFEDGSSLDQAGQDAKQRMNELEQALKQAGGRLQDSSESKQTAPNEVAENKVTDPRMRGLLSKLGGSMLSPESNARLRSYIKKNAGLKATSSSSATESVQDFKDEILGSSQNQKSELSEKSQAETRKGSQGSDGTAATPKITPITPKSSGRSVKLKTGSSDPNEYPQWFLDNNVILAEESGDRLPAGDIKMIKGTGDEVEISQGHEGLRTLLQQYQTLYEDEETNDDSLDDKVGPFATVPSIPKSKGGDVSVPQSYLSLPHYLEIALSVASGLAPHPAAQPWSSWGNQRTFLALYSPLDGSTDFLNQVIQAIAKSQEADVIQLSALDLAELSASMPSWENTPFLSSMSSISYYTHKAFAEDQREEKEKEDEADEDTDGQVMSIQLRGPQVGFRMMPGKGMRGSGLFMPQDRDVLMGQSVKELGLVLDAAAAKRAAKMSASSNSVVDSKPRKLILCVSDFAELSTSDLGQAVLKALEDLVQGRRKKSGQEIMIIGTSSSSETSTKGISTVQDQLDAGSENTYYRALIVPPFQEARIVDAQTANGESVEASITEDDIEQLIESPPADDFEVALASEKELDEQDAEDDPGAVWEKADAHRILNINSRHLKAMISQFCDAKAAAALEIPLDLDQEIIDEYEMDTQVFSLTEIHRIAILTAGMQHIKETDTPITSKDVQLAMSMIDANYTESMTPDFDYTGEDIESLALSPPRVVHDLEGIKAKCTKWEKRLLHCIISPNQLNTTFSKVHTKPDTIDALRTLTSMSLLRPDSFSYGVLQSESIPGVLLYGPPGTGKTLLAKAVAKESGATMLAITSSEINHKYVGESEKTVRAIFSLARKLSPCVVFIDEADSLFQSRGAFQSRAGSHETMNQFLSEIEHFGGSTASDGSDNVFLMIATNRPFDLDDAILRRVPRRLLVDLPTEKDREEILKIHLRGEDTSEEVSIPDLAKRTPFYSGSDLKNLCVAAALACVRDENAAAKTAREAGDKSHKYPAKRTISQENFETAIGEISASISEDMGTLTQIRKFDEKYGDRKGRREKTSLGFGQRKVTDDMLRVRV